MPENKIRSVKQKPFTPPTTSPTELTTYIGTPPKKSLHVTYMCMIYVTW